jgi:glycosyltransferase involved in cell wall biosynthesis
MGKPSNVFIDYTHIGRRASGIERITTELFNSDTLWPLKVQCYGVSGGRASVVMAQMFGLPLCAIRHPSDAFIFPGFPPSPYFAFARDRSILYVHDLFLLTRRGDLNNSGKYYMAPMFRLAIKKFRHFLTNSMETARTLREYCDQAATVMPYRPRIRNVFDLALGDRIRRASDPAGLRAVAIGTIEPRKNFVAAAKICAALSKELHRQVELHIIGRAGWGDDAKILSACPNVVLHNYLPDQEARPIIESSDYLICTSRQEGLGLPLLEVQYSGIPVVAPDDVIFREVLNTSGILIDPNRPETAALTIAARIARASWRAECAEASVANIERWNKIADDDRKAVISFLKGITKTEDNG